LRGHSPCGIGLIFEKEGFAIVGDALFAGSIGRTDFPGGSMSLLLGDIRENLFALPDETVVYSGHGPSTTIGKEKRFNPFF
jgi:hydroxyacylglutathione hydrolase